MRVLPVVRCALTALSLALALATLLPHSARAQTYTETTLHSFTGTSPDGAAPQASLVRDGSGNLFGTTQVGGTNGRGTVFEIVAGATAVTTLYSFTGNGINTDGATPRSGVTLDSGGNLFGTTENGGTNNQGTVFKIVKTGTGITGYATTIPTLYSFSGRAGATPSGDGSIPIGAVLIDGNGNIIGTTYGGGVSGSGTIFKIVKTGATYATTIPTIYSFSAQVGNNQTNADGQALFAGLIQDSSGNLFGTAFRGGTSGQGTVFELASGATTVTPLYSFTGTGTNTDGAQPYAGLLLDSSGNLFGATEHGGTSGAGTIFKIVKTGATYATTVPTLYSFTGTSTDGANPEAGLVRDGSGNLFGTTYNGGTAGNGVVFKIAAGTTTPVTLYSFTGSTTPGTFTNTDGANPQASLLVDSSGSLLGTSLAGGTSGLGTVFNVAPTPPSHTYVSGTGVDAAPCSRTAPCATFQYAHDHTAAGGTITALDAGEYGALTVSKAITLDGTGTSAGITTGAQNAITINAGTADMVVLRHLLLVGGGGQFGAGIAVLSAGSVIVDGCQLSRFGAGGLSVLAGSPAVVVKNTAILGGGFGITVSSGISPLLSLRDVSIQGTTYGVNVQGGAVDLKDSLVTQNTHGLLAGPGTISATGCILSGNGTGAQTGPNGVIRLVNNDLWNNGTAIDTHNGGRVSSSGNNRKAGSQTPGAAPTQGIATQ